MLKYYSVINNANAKPVFIAANTAKKAQNAFNHYRKDYPAAMLGQGRREHELSKEDRLLIAVCGTIAGGNHTFPSLKKQPEKPMQSPSMAIIDSRVPDKTVAKAHKIASSVGATIRSLTYDKDNGCRILRVFYSRDSKLLEGLSVNAHSLTEHKKYLESAFGSAA